jgi:hypothetical protein
VIRGSKVILLLLVAGGLGLIYLLGGWAFGILLEPLGKIIFWQFLIFGLVILAILGLVVLVIIGVIEALGCG